MPQQQRPDKLTVSLGVTDPQARRNNLKALALALGFPGRKGTGSISQLLIWLEDNAAAALDVLLPIAIDTRANTVPGFDD